MLVPKNTSDNHGNRLSVKHERCVHVVIRIWEEQLENAQRSQLGRTTRRNMVKQVYRLSYLTRKLADLLG